MCTTNLKCGYRSLIAFILWIAVFFCFVVFLAFKLIIKDQKMPPPHICMRRKCLMLWISAQTWIIAINRHMENSLMYFRCVPGLSFLEEKICPTLTIFVIIPFGFRTAFSFVQAVYAFVQEPWPGLRTQHCLQKKEKKQSKINQKFEHVKRQKKKGAEAGGTQDADAGLCGASVCPGWSERLQSCMNMNMNFFSLG